MKSNKENGKSPFVCGQLSDIHAMDNGNYSIIHHRVNDRNFIFGGGSQACFVTFGKG